MSRPGSHHRWSYIPAGLTFIGGLLACAAHLATAQVPPKAEPLVSAAPTAEAGPRWLDLTVQQRASLLTLETSWSSISLDQKLKWLEIAQRMPEMSRDERERIQRRMDKWVKRSPKERGQMRLNFQEAKQLSTEQLRAQWEAYQNLPEEQKRQLAGWRVSNQAVQPNSAGATPTGSQPGGRRASNDRSGKKSNITPNPAFAQPPTPIAPTLVHAGTGATTTLVGKRAAPPAHQQVGLPKIVATAGFIDPITLLPRRGPQAVAADSSMVSDTLERP